MWSEPATSNRSESNEATTSLWLVYESLKFRLICPAALDASVASRYDRAMRIVVGIVAGSDPAAVAEAVRGVGARNVQGPLPSLPDVLIAEFPEPDRGGTVKTVAALPGVRFAELDELRSILD
jgi:hypothetical protein